MPPKKQQKLDKTGLTGGRNRAIDKSKAKVEKSMKQSKVGKGKASIKESGKKKEKQSQSRQKASETVLQAASGAGIRTTAELQAYTRETRSKGKISSRATDLSEPVAQVSDQLPASEQPMQSAEQPSSSESSSSDSDITTSSDESDSEFSVDNPVRRKLPFDRNKGEFTPVQISPGSLENGQDVRDLGKLQDMLLTNPQAVTAISSMLDVIKAMQSGNEKDKSQANSSGTESRGHPLSAGQDRRVLPPPPQGAPPDAGPGMSETTIYTHAVPSASPSQQVQRDLGLCLDRLVVSGGVDRTDPAPALDPIVSNDLIPQVSFIGDNFNTADDATAGPDTHVDERQQQRQGEKARTDQMILEAERQKINLEKPVTGKSLVIDPRLKEILDQPGSHNLECDNNLYGLSVHLDLHTIVLIEAGQFVDLSKLLPQERVVLEDEPEKVRIVSEDGKPAFAPYVDRDAVLINSFKRWELAFDVYAGVYVRAHPKRGPEMLEYKHIIRRASDTYVWANVYNYDKIHRTHMQRNPGRTWSKKHKDAWSDHVKIYKASALGASPEVTNPGRKRKPCRYFNKNGKCNKGSACEFDHKCSFCGLFGHGRHNCRKLQATKKENGNAHPVQPSHSVSSTVSNSST